MNSTSNTSNFAPVVAFAYNRADKIIGCLKTLEQCPEAAETDLFIYSDGPKSEAGVAAVNETRTSLHEYEKTSRFKSVQIIEAPQNKGLAKSIIEGVTKVLNDRGRAIIVEDDLIVSESFLTYMNGALNFYQDRPEVGAICGYTYPLDALKSYPHDVYALHKGDCWGWATWEDRWDGALWADFDYDAYFRDRKLRRGFERTENGWDLLMLLQSQGKQNSWAIRWVMNLYKKGLLTIYPKKSLVTNNGFDGSGIHSNKSDEKHYFGSLSDAQKKFTYTEPIPDKRLEKEAATYPRKGLYQGVKYYLKRCYVHLYDIKRLIAGR